ncbi:MAG: hypothetical protein ACT4PX_02005 [Actinomycetota bacterium]
MPLRLRHRRAAPGRRRHEGPDWAASGGAHPAGDESGPAAGPGRPLEDAGDEAGFPLLRAATLYTLGSDAWDAAVFGEGAPPAGAGDPSDRAAEATWAGAGYAPTGDEDGAGDEDGRWAGTMSLLHAATLYTLGADLDGPDRAGDDEDDVDLDGLDDPVPPPLPAPARRPGRRRHRRRGRRPRVLVAAAFVLAVTAAGATLPGLRDTPSREITTTAPPTAPATTPTPLEASPPATAPALGEAPVQPVPETTAVTTLPATTAAPVPLRRVSTAPAATTSTTAATPTTTIVAVPTTTVPPEPATSTPPTPPTPPTPTTTTTAPATTTTTQPPASTTTSSTSTTAAP